MREYQRPRKRKWNSLRKPALRVVWLFSLLPLLGCSGVPGGGGSSVGGSTSGGLPVIIIQPQDVIVTEPDQASFTVQASGALSFQWTRNGVNIPGAIAESYTTFPTTLEDNGAIFQVVVSNQVGSVTSNPAVLTVTLPPELRITKGECIRESGPGGYYPAPVITITATGVRIGDIIKFYVRSVLVGSESIRVITTVENLEPRMFG